MAYDVRHTDAFARDLDETLAYLCFRLAAPGAAETLLDLLEYQTELISANPELFAISQKASLAKHEIREAYIKKYVILYKIEGTTVYFVRLFHMTQDYERYV
jgi:plasmid stabilization system protein ParE